MTETGYTASNLFERLFLYLSIGLLVTVIVVSLYSLVTPPHPSWITLGGILGPQQPHVALVRIEGPITSTTSILSPFSPTVKDYIRLLKDLEISPFVSAVVLYIDSPGGDAGASFELYKAVENLARKKPVVVYTPGVLASGAYLAASPASKIYASPFAVVGSIGVVLEVPKIGGLLERVGIRVYVFKNGSLKDVGSLYSTSLREEEIKILEELVNDAYRNLVKLVKKHRPNISVEVFSSAIYSSIKAEKLGLIDSIGSLDDAVKEARRLANLPPQAPVVEYSATRGLLDILFGSKPASTLSSNDILSYLFPRVVLVAGH